MASHYIVLIIFLLTVSLRFLYVSAQDSMPAYAHFSEEPSVAPEILKRSLSMPAFNNLSKENIDMGADSYEYVGSNLVAKGHVVLRIKNMQITADSAVINLLTKDMEASGNVQLSTKITSAVQLTRKEYEEYQENPAIKVVTKGITTAPDGRQKILAEVTYVSSYLQAKRVSGSILTGNLQFTDFKMKAGISYFSGKFAERYPDGTIKLFDSNVSTCEYQLDDNAHYAIASKEITVTPRENNRNIANYNPDQGEHSLLAVNNFLKVWDIPVFWLPVLYKPRDTNMFGIRFTFGGYTRWGTYIRTLKEFELLSEPAIVKAGVMVDYYSKRGLGFGLTTDIITPDSMTEFFGYYIYDRSPYEYWDSDRGNPPSGVSEKQWLKRYGRYELPKNRYEFRLSNITHLTPRLDFRGQLDIISDYNFLEDYFKNRYDRDIQPPTFAGFEYQGDRFSAAIMAAYKINDFDTAVNRLPEIRLDFQRQELFKNIYYQGQTSAGYYQMKWRSFDFSRDENPDLKVTALLAKEGLSNAFGNLGDDQAAALRYLAKKNGVFSGYLDDPDDYSAFRFDTLHGIYYPMKLFDVLNLTPRALVRFTAYSQSSKAGVDIEDLYKLYSANQLDSWPSSTLKIQNYDDDGGAKYRFAFELGLEGNMKFYRTWQEPKSAFLRIDGLRHVLVPYFNLVYIPEPTEDYENLYYFDEVDQIEKQAFIRFGMQNRLQTRRNGRVYEWISMENYWDFHFEEDYGFNHVGDLGTLVKFSPTENLSIFGELLLDIGGNNDHDAKVYQGGKEVGQPGISTNFINRLRAGIDYTISKDWQLGASYNFSDAYAQRTAMSMGSTLTQIVAMSNFKSYFSRSQYISAYLKFPTYIDKRLNGVFRIEYDVEANIIEDASLMLTRNFHCWFVAAGVGVSSQYDDDGDRSFPWTLSFTVGLSAMPSLLYTSSFGGTVGGDGSD